LAQIHFSRGKEAAALVHDGIGHAAFFVSAGILLLAAFWMLHAAAPGARVVRHIQSHPTPP
jgi:hypothetical protein